MPKNDTKPAPSKMTNQEIKNEHAGLKWDDGTRSLDLQREERIRSHGDGNSTGFSWEDSYRRDDN